VHGEQRLERLLAVSGSLGEDAEELPQHGQKHPAGFVVILDDQDSHVRTSAAIAAALGLHAERPRNALEVPPGSPEFT
jgi:hypothetical protein